MKLSEGIIRGYIWRAKNPDKFKTIVKKYFEKKRAKTKEKSIAVESQETEGTSVKGRQPLIPSYLFFNLGFHAIL
jgi:hypothetical protein